MGGACKKVQRKVVWGAGICAKRTGKPDVSMLISDSPSDKEGLGEFSSTNRAAGKMESRAVTSRVEDLKRVSHRCWKKEISDRS